MSKLRSHCPTNYALEHFGDRWTLLIIREMLFFGRSYYRDFLSAQEGISTNILATRLKRMQSDGLIEQRPASDARRVRYVLTDKGIDLVRIMTEINRWSARHDPETDVPPDYAALLEQDFESVVAGYRAKALTTRRG